MVLQKPPKPTLDNGDILSQLSRPMLAQSRAAGTANTAPRTAHNLLNPAAHLRATNGLIHPTGCRSSSELTLLLSYFGHLSLSPLGRCAARYVSIEPCGNLRAQPGAWKRPISTCAGDRPCRWYDSTTAEAASSQASDVTGSAARYSTRIP